MSARETILLGDIDQCHPAGTMIETTTGEVRIEDLDPETHRIVSYDRRSGSVVGRRDGYAFKMEATARLANVQTVTLADGKSVAATSEHRMWVRWRRENEKHCCVYLMRRGNRFRVGWCQVLGNDNYFHFGRRAKLEDADEAWILRVFPDRREASDYESAVAANYGLPLMTFRAVGDYDPEGAWRQINEADNKDRALQALLDHSREYDFPLWSRYQHQTKRGKRCAWFVRACNLEPELMELPARPDNHRSVDWQTFTVKRHAAFAWYYSLEVDRHELYFANGVLVHNSLYCFRGATEDVMQVEGRPRILEQSWRVPARPHAVACSILEPTWPYKPTPDEGTVRRDAPSLRELGGHIAEAVKAAAADHIAADGKRGDRTMFLCSSGAQVSRVTRALQTLGVPYHNPYTPRWNPLGGGGRDVTTTVDRIRSFLRPKLYEEEWTIPDLKRWASVVACGEAGMRRGAKKVLEELDGSEDASAVARDILQPAAWQWTQTFDLDRFVSHTTATFQKAAAYPLKVAKMRGLDALTTEPRIVVGTTHSTKGGEAERVVVFPDLPMPFWEQYQRDGWEHRESVRRMFYVACTRTRRDLILARPAGRLFVEI